MAERNDIEETIVERATHDTDFRTRLFTDPHAAIAEFTGTTLPDDLVVRVEEEQPGEIVLVIPPAEHPNALADTELATTAGGGWTNGCTDTCTDRGQAR